jgi:xylulokinase
LAPFILVYDVGTSSLKAVVYDEHGDIVTKKSKFYEFAAPRQGWAEIDPQVWWNSLKSVTGELAEEIELSPLQGIALTGQMHSAVLLGEDDEAVAPSILWLDRRASEETEELQERFGLKPYKLNSSYTLPKLYWLSRYNPEVLQEVRTMLWPKDYLRFMLTGVKVTDYTEGIGSSLIDWEKREWLPERIEACGMTTAVLPEIRPQEEMYGLRPEVAEELGLPASCKVLVGCGDIAALLGGAPHRPGRLVYSMGSSSMYFTEAQNSPEEGNGLYTLRLAGYRLFGGVTSTAGASLNWAFEKLWGGEDVINFHQMVEEVMKADAQDESLLFFPFLAGERSPFWSDKISGSFEGLKLHHDKYHLTRAVMEGVAFSIRYILDLMEELNVEVEEIALCGGGAKTSGWPEIIAAATGKKVVIYNAEETVTTVLYAIMASALRGESFRETLAALFTEPKAVRADDGGERYRRLYRNYRRFLGAKIQTYESMGSE